jgi:hypothetical protein
VNRHIPSKSLSSLGREDPDCNEERFCRFPGLGPAERKNETTVRRLTLPNSRLRFLKESLARVHIHVEAI